VFKNLSIGVLALLLAARTLITGRASVVRPRGTDLLWLSGAIVANNIPCYHTKI